MAPRTSLNNLISDIVARAAAEIATAIRQFEGEQSTSRKPSVAPRMTSRRPYPRRVYSDTEIDRVIGFIRLKPGLRAEEIQKEFGDTKMVKKVLAKLRGSGQVKTIGTKRAMTYSVT